MKRISIERYKNAAELQCAGLIEGETDSGRHWILFLDEDGGPRVYWPERGENGVVVGEGVPMPDMAQPLHDHSGASVSPKPQ